MTTVSLLIVLGGLGYTVLFEVIDRGWRGVRSKPQPIVWSLNTRVVLFTTLVLIIAGAVAFDLLGMERGKSDWSSRAGHALFQSITARTAGFNTVNIGDVALPALLWLAMLMFVGGSPGSCAGGIKTTSLAIWFARLRARLRLQDDVNLGGRRIPVDLVRRTGLLVATCGVFNLAGIFILAVTETGQGQGVELRDILFEQISAFATVGLSTGLTPLLTATGKLWIILTMFVGRLGPLTIALVVIDHKPASARLAEERLMIG